MPFLLVFGNCRRKPLFLSGGAVGRNLKDGLICQYLGESQIRALVEPTNYLGQAQLYVDAVLNHSNLFVE